MSRSSRTRPPQSPRPPRGRRTPPRREDARHRRHRQIHHVLTDHSLREQMVRAGHRAGPPLRAPQYRRGVRRGGRERGGDVKLAVVSPRYGVDIAGGAEEREASARVGTRGPHQFARRGPDDVRADADSWSDSYAPGTVAIDGATVHRFPGSATATHRRATGTSRLSPDCVAEARQPPW